METARYRDGCLLPSRRLSLFLRKPLIPLRQPDLSGILLPKGSNVVDYAARDRKPRIKRGFLVLVGVEHEKGSGKTVVFPAAERWETEGLHMVNEVKPVRFSPRAHFDKLNIKPNKKP